MNKSTISPPATNTCHSGRSGRRMLIVAAALCTSIIGVESASPDASANVGSGRYKMLSTVGGSTQRVGTATVSGDWLTVRGNGVTDGRYRIHPTRTGGYVDGIRMWGITYPGTRWNFVRTASGYVGGSYVFGIRTGTMRLTR